MSEKSNTFKDELLKELKESEFEKLGLSKNPFLPFIPKDIINTFVNRVEERRLLIRYLPELIKDFVPLLILSGSKGIGKTHFLNYIYTELKEISSEIGHDIEILTIDNFKTFYDKYKIGEIRKLYVILIDDSEKIWNTYKNEFVELIDSCKNIKFIAVWNSTKWNQIKTDSFYASLKPVCIKLEKIKKQDLIEIVKTRISSVCLGESPFEEKALELLTDISDGIPYSMVYFSEKLLHFALNKNIYKIDEELTKEFITELNIKQFDITTLTKKQLYVLKELLNLTTSEKRGVTSTELANHMELTRTAIIPHLKFLSKNKKIIDEKLENKKNLYYIKPMLIERIENYFGSTEI